MGIDSLEPFFKYKEKLHFVLGLTSNPSSENFEKLILKSEEPLYKNVISRCSKWNEKHQNIGVVVGGTQDELKKIRSIDPSLLFLIPGIGAQGGNYSKSYKEGKNNLNLAIINASRSILYQNPELSFKEKINKTIES